MLIIKLFNVRFIGLFDINAFDSYNLINLTANLQYWNMELSKEYKNGVQHLWFYFVICVFIFDLTK